MSTTPAIGVLPFYSGQRFSDGISLLESFCIVEYPIPDVKVQVLVLYREAAGRSQWLTGEELCYTIQAQSHAEVLPALQAVEQATAQGLFAIGFVAYEAAHGLDQAFPKTHTHNLPLVWFGVFRRLRPAHKPADAFVNAPNPAERLCWQPTLSRTAYYGAVERIREYIASGDVYQVNYTFRLRTPFDDDPLALFWRLYQAQPVPYAAYLDIGEHVILSLSPELFFKLDGEHIVACPMKGTALRGKTLEDDLQQAHKLHASPKDRAENLMIVDMARNDLGRIACTGTVRVPCLFEVERYATLWQMTSTVEAQTNAPLSEIFRALFPAASITGAPKIRATQIIQELETTPRSIYTGAMGIVLPNRRAQFNVAIRTLYYDRAQRQLEYGVGSGVVWDSEQQAEYEECLTKAHLLLHPRPEFELLETILWRPRKGYFLLERHLRRLQRSADYFGFRLDKEVIRARLRPLHESLCVEGERNYRVRLRVGQDGTVNLGHAPLEPKPRVWRVTLTAEPVDPHDVFLYHKTTHRTVYDRARSAHPDCDDVILWNRRGEITESTIANVVMRLKGKLYTPPVSCGLLAGVYREHLLERGWIEERIITVDELLQAEAVYLINSVRGWIRTAPTWAAGH